MKFVIAGGSGSLGRHLSWHFHNAGHEVIVLTRHALPDTVIKQVQWDGKTVGPWADHLQDAIIINLAGQLVDRPATTKNIELLRSSRVDSTNALKNALTQNNWTAPLWLQMSTLAIYGDCGDAVLDERAEPVHPLPQMTGVAQPWEEAFAGAPAERSVIMRAGIVLANDTPAMQRLIGLTQAGVGGKIGDGRQWVSWIHVDDFVSAVQFFVDNNDIEGIVHLATPNAVRNEELMSTLRKVLHRPAAPPTPSLLVKVGATALGSDSALGLTGRHCVPQKLADHGFTWRYPELENALQDLADNRSHSIVSLLGSKPKVLTAALARAERSAFTYADVGATRGEMPKGFHHDTLIFDIGHGRELFERCSEFLDQWNLQRAMGFTLYPNDGKVEAGQSLVFTMRLAGLEVMAACRVVYTVDEPNRHGFAYGTLPDHPECGEEYFGLSIDENDLVRFEVRAFSRTRSFLSRLGGPVSRRMQLAAMHRYGAEMQKVALT